MKNILIVSVGLGIPVAGFCSTDPDSLTYYLNQAKSLKEARRINEAEKSFLKAIEFEPNNNRLRVEYGNFLVDVRKLYPAVKQFELIFKLEPSNAVALQKLTEINFLLHKWKEVLEYGNQLLKNNAENGVAYMMGKAYYEEEDYGQSEKYLNIAIANNSKNLEAIILLGRVYIELSNYKQAITIYTKALELNPEDPILTYEFGMLYSTINNEKEAVRYFEIAAKKGYKIDLNFKENIGMSYLAFDIPKGIEVLNEVLLKKPNDPEIMLQIAQAHFKSRNFQVAADAYYKIYLIDPSNGKALYMTGIAYQRKGDKVLGNSYCEQAIKMDPTLAELKTLKFSL